MKLTELKLTNFRGYKNETSISFEKLTVLIGRNDAGKSTLLDALNIYFNDAAIESDDASINGNATNVRISCVFDELPKEIIIDSTYKTTLQQEYLVREDGKLEIIKTYNCSTAKPKCSSILALANHPTAEGCNDLLGLKLTPLKTRCRDRGVNLSTVNQTIASELRQAIWTQPGVDLALSRVEVDLTAESGKAAWEQIAQNIPLFALFKSDRASTDQDEEAQDPMKAAIKETIKGYESQLNSIVAQVSEELNRVAKRTVEKIQEMSPELANELTPKVKNKNWDSLFSVSLNGDEGISVNKRGSGTRRLILLNFFRAKAEDAASSKKTGIIYAIEEPETSQHPNHQLMLLDAFEDLVDQDHCQVILTTHTPTLARKVNRNSLRFIYKNAGIPVVAHGRDDATLDAIKHTLGVLPDHDVKVFLGVEGKWDIQFLTRISKKLSATDTSIPDLEAAERSGKLVFVPLGGSSMELWANRLAGLDRAEFYITDRDETPPALPKYHAHITAWNQRVNCTAWATTKRELENYLHVNSITPISQNFPTIINDFDDVPMMLAESLHVDNPAAPAWATVDADKRKEKANRAKRRLNQECVDNMTVALLSVSDPNNEISTWLRQIGVRLSN